MAKQPGTAQIGTPAPRRLKSLWDREWLRLRDEAGITHGEDALYAGHAQLALIALHLTKDAEERNANIRAGLKALEPYEVDEPSVPAGAGVDAFAGGDTAPVDTGRAGNDRAIGPKRALPKRRR